MAIYETRARSTHYTRTKVVTPETTTSTSSPTRRHLETYEGVRHYSHALQYYSREKKNLLVRVRQLKKTKSWPAYCAFLCCRLEFF